MRKIYKIINIALIFMVIEACQDLTYASDTVSLRVPIGVKRDRVDSVKDFLLDKNVSLVQAEKNNEEKEALSIAKRFSELLQLKISNILLGEDLSKEPSLQNIRIYVIKTETPNRIKISGIHGIRIATLIGHILIQHLGGELNSIFMSTSKTFSSNINHAISICRIIDTILNYEDKKLVLQLLRSEELKIMLGYKPDEEHMPEIEDFDKVVKITRELIVVFKFEILKSKLFELVKLCGEDPEEILKEWYRKENRPEANRIRAEGKLDINLPNSAMLASL